MATYIVSYRIEVEADTMQAAALEAYDAMYHAVYTRDRIPFLLEVREERERTFSVHGSNPPVCTELDEDDQDP